MSRYYIFLLFVKCQMLVSVEALNVAVRQARERANTQEVEAKEIGEALLGFVFKNGSL